MRVNMMKRVPQLLAFHTRASPSIPFRLYSTTFQPSSIRLKFFEPYDKAASKLAMELAKQPNCKVRGLAVGLNSKAGYCIVVSVQSADDIPFVPKEYDGMEVTTYVVGKYVGLGEVAALPAEYLENLQTTQQSTFVLDQLITLLAKGLRLNEGVVMIGCTKIDGKDAIAINVVDSQTAAAIPSTYFGYPTVVTVTGLFQGQAETSKSSPPQPTGVFFMSDAWKEKPQDVEDIIQKPL